jgi:DUF4097 and DUF4098 domain-containing protein YvlB
MLVKITTRRGRVYVTAQPGMEFSVERGVLEHLTDDVVLVRRARSDDRIEVLCAPGTDLSIGTASGNIEVNGLLGSVRVSTGSGKVVIGEAREVDVRTHSGLVQVESSSGDCRVVTKSGKVLLGKVGQATIAAVSGLVAIEEVESAQVKTVSGKVLIGTVGSGDLAIKTVSGRIDIKVPPDRRPDVRVKTVSGKVERDTERGDDGTISVASVSGRVRVSAGQ